MGLFMNRLDPLKGAIVGRVLDVGTGDGRFVGALIENLGQYSEIIGIDSNPTAVEAARRAYPQPQIQFLCMDATQMDFPDDSFDTVSMSNTLHHLNNYPTVFQEIRRVLKPGGQFIFCEYYSDDQNEAQLTHVYLHHWRGLIDRQYGLVHNPTFTRRELLQILDDLNLLNTTSFDYADYKQDPLNRSQIAELENVIDQYMEKAAVLPYGEAYRRQGETLRQRLHTVGFLTASQLIAIGRK